MIDPRMGVVNVEDVINHRHQADAAVDRYMRQQSMIIDQLSSALDWLSRQNEWPRDVPPQHLAAVGLAQTRAADLRNKTPWETTS